MAQTNTVRYSAKRQPRQDTQARVEKMESKRRKIQIRDPRDGREITISALLAEPATASSPIPSIPPTASSSGVIMDAKDAKPSTSPTTTTFTWAQIVAAKKPTVEVRRVDPAPTEQRRENDQPTTPQQSPHNERERVQPLKEPLLQRDRSKLEPPADQNTTDSTVTTPQTTGPQVDEQISHPTTQPNANDEAPQEQELMEAEEAEPSTPQSPTALSWGEIMDIEDPLTDTPLNFIYGENTKGVELFIDNLDDSVDDMRLCEEFVSFGIIINAKVVMENGCSKGFGFISFLAMEEAKMAIEKMNGAELENRKLYVALSNGNEERQLDPAQTEQKTDSSQTTTPQQSPINESERVQPHQLEPLPQQIPRRPRQTHDRSTPNPPAAPNTTDSTVSTAQTTEPEVEAQTGHPTTQPSTNHKTQEQELIEAKEAEPSAPPTPTALNWAKIAAANVEKVVEPKKEQRKQTVEVQKNNNNTGVKPQLRRNTKKSRVPQRVDLYLSNLDYSVDDKDLHDEFLPFGHIVHAKVVMENGRSKGFGFVGFLSMKEAMTAVEEMNGKKLGRRTLYVALAKSKKERQHDRAQTEQRTGSSQPTTPKATERVQPQRKEPLPRQPQRTQRCEEAVPSAASSPTAPTSDGIIIKKHPEPSTSLTPTGPTWAQIVTGRLAKPPKVVMQQP